MAKKDRLRNKARSRARFVIERHGSECYYCGAPLVSIQTLRRSQVVKVSGRHVWWTNNGFVRQDLFLTLDHVIPIAEGGSNELNNLVPACSKCNNARNKEQPCNAPIEADRKRICPKCGRPKHPHRRKCRICRAGYQYRYNSHLHLFDDIHARTQLRPLLDQAFRDEKTSL